MTSFSWTTWHDGYADPDSDLSHRLSHVKRRLAAALDAAPPGPIRLISLCAGEGRDVIGVLPDHPRRVDVTARLVELDPEIAGKARSAAAAAGLNGVEVIAGDAAIVGNYVDLVPADVIVACGIFGNIEDDDIKNTIRGLRQLAAPGARVLWTRHRKAPDLTPAVRSWFGEAGFEDVAFDHEEGRSFGVGTQRFAGVTAPLEPENRLFTFRPRDHSG